ncbi:helix-turn-helix transcriptional regulator [Actinomadura miaoliensis]|uniref:HTH cro/C1-type domain-containing protein n=1 Tax=Actinomadura miaoliensis TaxID=430685 RepID=A0ABP7VTZ3_9ACTN
MPSPYVRRLLLAAEIRKLRESRDLTTDEFARLVYQSRSKIIRLENGTLRVDLYDLMNMLDRLEVTGTQQEKIIRLARDAGEKHWWDRYGNAMGPRQRLYADLESGADTIREYNQTAIPAVLQTPEFVDALVELDRCQGSLDYRPERMAEARKQRQNHLLKEDGPTYEAIVDEYVMHRLAVPRPVMAAQLRHMVDVVTAEERIIVRILPNNVLIPGGLLPLASFSLYTFPDPGDPPMAVVETVTTDLVLTQRREVARYTGMYNRLRDAALSRERSLAHLNEVADRLTDERKLTA